MAFQVRGKYENWPEGELGQGGRPHSEDPFTIGPNRPSLRLAENNLFQNLIEEMNRIGDEIEDGYLPPQSATRIFRYVSTEHKEVPTDADRAVPGSIGAGTLQIGSTDYEYYLWIVEV